MNPFIKVLSVAALAFGFACAPTQSIAQKVDTAIDCRGICARYATCYDVSYDTGRCESQCRSTANTDGDFRRKADACSECITGVACTQTSASCGNECSTVIPMPAASSSR